MEFPVKQAGDLSCPGPIMPFRSLIRIGGLQICGICVIVGTVVAVENVVVILVVARLGYAHVRSLRAL